MSVKVYAGANPRVVDEENGKVYTPQEWEKELNRRVNENKSKKELNADEEGEDIERSDKKDESGVEEDTDEE